MRARTFPVRLAACAFAVLIGCSTKPSTDAERSPASEEAEKTSWSPRGERPEDRNQVDDDGVVRRGDALSDRPTLSVADVMAKGKALDGELVKVTGRVGKVCGKSGCWFELKGNSGRGIRITSKGYRFFVPSKAGGMRATLEGDLTVRLLDVQTAQHYADDEAEGTGRPAEKITAPVPEVSIAAVGLEMSPTQGG